MRKINVEYRLNYPYKKLIEKMIDYKYNKSDPVDIAKNLNSAKQEVNDLITKLKEENYMVNDVDYFNDKLDIITKIIPLIKSIDEDYLKGSTKTLYSKIDKYLTTDNQQLRLILDKLETISKIYKLKKQKNRAFIPGKNKKGKVYGEYSNNINTYLGMNLKKLNSTLSKLENPNPLIRLFHFTKK